MNRQITKRCAVKLTKLFSQYAELSNKGADLTTPFRAFLAPQAPIIVITAILVVVISVPRGKEHGVMPPSIEAPSQKLKPDIASKNLELISTQWSQKIIEPGTNHPFVKFPKYLAHVNYQPEQSLKRMEMQHILGSDLSIDVEKLSIAQKRKITFINSMLPLIQDVNEVIKKDRRRIASLYGLIAKGQNLSPEDAAWLTNTAKRYSLDNVDFSQLLKRVDIVPPSLAIAQAAEESGWGTSRFVREGNALFGQRAYSSRGKGIVPKDRPIGMKFRVRAFDSLIDSVKAYVHNLNTHFAYRDFRENRSTLRANFGHVNGYELAGSLLRYSERGEDYVHTIRSIMRFNRLQIFDAA